MYPNPTAAQPFPSGVTSWSEPMFTAGAAVPAGHTVIITPGASYCWQTPLPGCAGIPVGYTYTFTIGGTADDDGTAGVREPALR
jgi:hypothetical protein